MLLCWDNICVLVGASARNSRGYDVLLNDCVQWSNHVQWATYWSAVNLAVHVACSCSVWSKSKGLHESLHAKRTAWMKARPHVYALCTIASIARIDQHTAELVDVDTWTQTLELWVFLSHVQFRHNFCVHALTAKLNQSWMVIHVCKTVKTSYDQSQELCGIVRPAESGECCF